MPSVVDIRFLQAQKSANNYVGILCEARKKKGMTEQQARDSLQDINVYGTLMVLAGDADGMVSGATTTTANTIRPALQVSHASHVMYHHPLHKHVFTRSRDEHPSLPYVKFCSVLCTALSCPALPCPALPCPALPCPALPCPVLDWNAQSCVHIF